MMQELDKEQYKSVIEKCDALLKTIDEEVARYIGKEDKRQGITRNPEPTVMNRIYGASRYVQTRKSGITQTEKTLIEHAQKQLNEALKATNSFFKDQWTPFRTEMEKQLPSPFKSTEELSFTK